MSFFAAWFVILLMASPRTFAQTQKYLFYFHGAWIEQHGLGQAHPRHGRYQYGEIVQAFADQGFLVKSEVRSGKVVMGAYADQMVKDIRSLLDQGVPAEQITLCGHSKGGQIALLVASRLGEPRVNYVVMAGCGRKGAEFRQTYERFLQRGASTLTGRILSLYDEADREAGTCREALSQVRGGQTQEIVLRTGRGHGLFYAPDPVWINELIRWSERKQG